MGFVSVSENENKDHPIELPRAKRVGSSVTRRWIIVLCRIGSHSLSRIAQNVRHLIVKSEDYSLTTID